MKSLTIVTKLSLLFIMFFMGTALALWIRNLTARSSLEIKPETVASDIPAQIYPPWNFPVPTPTPENTSLAHKPAQYLCDHLDDLKHMAWEGTGYSGDAVYDGLKRNGYYAIPCLADKITDTRPATNPTGAPFWAGYTYRVGDTAMFMLMDINEMNWPKGMMPTKYEEMFKTEGMFAYFDYVHSVPGSRKNVQRWWRNWIKTCQPECKVVPLLEN